MISDRYVYSTIAYQGYGRGLGLGLVDRLNREATGGLEPDLAILMNLPAEAALSRIGPNNDNFDEAPQEFHSSVREGYRRIAEENKETWLVLDADQPAVGWCWTPRRRSGT